MTIDQQTAERLASSMDGARGVVARITGAQVPPETPSGKFDEFLSAMIAQAENADDLADQARYFSRELEQFRANAAQLTPE